MNLGNKTLKLEDVRDIINDLTRNTNDGELEDSQIVKNLNPSSYSENLSNLDSSTYKDN